ncbi:hypothetical protein M2165_000320 [Variovorax sp. TBS-050B]|uniref:hypothetical protein n=1 Tax=Variovorax sp. TBS-050B TaxID=2940551 RepID=UPI002474288B|nr:hypothetical protein [Variovorax sp. TBS-050B]MDH6590431.1 hypothetical protein [Variovorax sp. TBS-050B]
MPRILVVPVSKKSSRMLLALLGSFLAAQAWAIDLITDAEARLPSAYAEGKRAGLTRGPGIEVQSPSGAVDKGAMALKVGFKPRGGVAIDPKSVRVVYMKSPAVDLTERVRTHVSESGIAIDGARVPAGEHQLKVDVADTEGRISSKLISFKAD